MRANKFRQTMIQLLRPHTTEGKTYEPGVYLGEIAEGAVGLNQWIMGRLLPIGGQTVSIGSPVTTSYAWDDGDPGVNAPVKIDVHWWRELSPLEQLAAGLELIDE